MGPTGVVGQHFYAPLSTGRPAQCGEDQVTAGGRSQTGPGRRGWPALLSDLAGRRAQYLSGNEPRVLCTYSRRELWKLIILSPFDLHDNSRRLPQHPRHYVPWERRERGGRRKETKRERKKYLGKSRLRSLQHEVTEIPDILWNRSLSCKNRR